MRKTKLIVSVLLMLALCLSVTACSSSSKIFFTTQDLDGKNVYGDEIFAANEVTMVNLFATWCGPCMAELPDLAKISKEYKGKGVQVLGICLDQNAATNAKEIKNKLKSCGVNYQIIINNSEIEDVFRSQYIPATFFVDSDGKIIGEPIVGADVEAYKTRLNEILSVN